MTLNDYLAAAYSYACKLDDVTVDPAAACAAAGFPMAEIQARRDAMARVERRCIVSKIGREFLDRVIAFTHP